MQSPFFLFIFSCLPFVLPCSDGSASGKKKKNKKKRAKVDEAHENAGADAEAELQEGSQHGTKSKLDSDGTELQESANNNHSDNLTVEEPPKDR